MKRKITIITGATLLIITGFYAKTRFYNPKYTTDIASNPISLLTDKNEIKNGDIIFQTSLSSQSKAIQLATHSPYSHCGIIYKNGDEYFVYEAIEPVKQTPLNKWIERGQNGHFVIKRLKNAEQILTTSILQKMKQAGDRFNGKHYDLYFEWSDDKIYCSELIWKIYKSATGIEIGKLEQLKDFNLTNASVKQKMQERYGNKIPFEETVISPASIYNSDLLETVVSK